MMDMTYIPMDQAEAEFLAAYDPSKFPIITSTVDLALFAGSKTQGLFYVLLIKRGNYPYKNCWALPGGFINPNETLLAAAVRETTEETGVEVSESMVRFLRMLDDPDRDPRGRCLSALHTAKFDMPVRATGMDDAVDAGWFPVEFALDLNLAFDHRVALTEGAKYWGILTTRTWSDDEVGSDDF